VGGPRGRTRGPCRICFGIASLLLVSLLPHAFGQVFEDTLDPQEIGILDLDSLVTPPAVYVGNEVCMGCHAASYRKWLGTKHSRAFVPMRSQMAMMMAQRAGITACCPDRSGKCLRCHATAHNVPADFRGPQFRMGEGVSCEACHGPGGSHVEAAASAASDAKACIEIPAAAHCMACHGSKPWHEMVTSGEPFSLEDSFKKIEHKENQTR
jgi:hypothetical protein